MAVASVLATRAVQPILGLGLLTGMVALFWQRWFCRWVCPMGLCLDGVSFLGRFLKRKPCQSLSVGRWLLALTLGGAILGCPLFLWLDPLALFSGLFLSADQGQQVTWIVCCSLVVILLAISLLRPHVWCRGLCPLGALQDLLVQSLRIKRRPSRDLQRRGPWVHPVARRTLLGSLVGLASAGLLRGGGREMSRPLRPPGAVKERILRGLCTRCGNCVRSCPHKIIRRDTGQHGTTSLLTPVLSFDQDYCREDCVDCTRVCPSGALVAVDLDTKARTYIGLAQVDMKRCLLGEDRECSACMRWCPYNAIRYIFSEEEYTLVPRIDAAKCNGCGACETACPTSPRKAIRVSSDRT